MRGERGRGSRPAQSRGSRTTLSRIRQGQSSVDQGLVFAEGQGVSPSSFQGALGLLQTSTSRFAGQGLTPLAQEQAQPLPTTRQAGLGLFQNVTSCFTGQGLTPMAQQQSQPLPTSQQAALGLFQNGIGRLTGQDVGVTPLAQGLPTSPQGVLGLFSSGTTRLGGQDLTSLARGQAQSLPSSGQGALGLFQKITSLFPGKDVTSTQAQPQPSSVQGELLQKSERPGIKGANPTPGLAPKGREPPNEEEGVDGNIGPEDQASAGPTTWLERLKNGVALLTGPAITIIGVISLVLSFQDLSTSVNSVKNAVLAGANPLTDFKYLGPVCTVTNIVWKATPKEDNRTCNNTLTYQFTVQDVEETFQDREDLLPFMKTCITSGDAPAGTFKTSIKYNCWQAADAQGLKDKGLTDFYGCKNDPCYKLFTPVSEANASQPQSNWTQQEEEKQEEKKNTWEDSKDYLNKAGIGATAGTGTVAAVAYNRREKKPKKKKPKKKKPVEEVEEPEMDDCQHGTINIYVYKGGEGGEDDQE